jgi:hypothetical protein
MPDGFPAWVGTTDETDSGDSDRASGANDVEPSQESGHGLHSLPAWLGDVDGANQDEILVRASPGHWSHWLDA